MLKIHSNLFKKDSEMQLKKKLPLSTDRTKSPRRKTATERLEADKFKYVKSEEARQRRFTLELRTGSPPNNNDSSGSHSMGTESTGTPSNMEEEDGIEDVLTEDIITSMAGVISYKEPKKENIVPQNKPSVAEQLHAKSAERRRQRSANHTTRSEEVSNQGPTSPLIARLRKRLANSSTSSTSDSPTLSITSAGKLSSAGSPMSESASSQLGFTSSKTPDSISSSANKKVVNFEASEETTRNSRKPRSTTTSNFQSRRYRSASAGANVNRQIREINNEKQIDPIMSPRTQLKLARENLKKVPNATPSQTVSNAEYARQKLTSYNKFRENNTFKITLKKNLTNEVNPNLSTKPPYPPKAVSKPSTRKEKIKADRGGSRIPLQDHTTDLRVANNGKSATSRLLAREVLQNQTNMPSNEPNVRDDSSSKSNENTNNQPPMTNSQQRKSWSKVPTKNEPKLNNRMSLPEDSMQPYRTTGNQIINKSGTRKSFAEALDDILNPVYESDNGRDTPVVSRATTTSPDTISLTVVESESSDNRTRRRNSSVADNINSALGGATTDEAWSQKSNFSESESQENLLTKAMLNNSRKYNYKLRNHRKSADNIIEDIWVKNYKDMQVNESNAESHKVLKDKAKQHRNSVNHTRQNSAPAMPVHNRKEIRRMQGKSWDETKDNYMFSNDDYSNMAPRSRKEVLPDYGQRPGPTIECVNDDHATYTNTLKSTTSVDQSKPFIALTANDLKPRTHAINPGNQSAPVKALFAYPSSPAPQTRQNPKRHTGPVSPTLSPQKQIPRLTPPQTPSRSTNSTPYSSLKRTPNSSRNSSLKRSRHRKSDSSPLQSELDRFFSTMGMDESILQPESYFSGNHVSSESDFSLAGASAYVRDSQDEMMDLDPTPAPFAKQPQTVSIIEKNARVLRWLKTCRENSKKASNGNSPRHSSSAPVKAIAATQQLSIQSTSKHSIESSDKSSAFVFHSCADEQSQPPVIPPRYKREVNLHYNRGYQSAAPPVPPRTYMQHADLTSIPKESDV